VPVALAIRSSASQRAFSQWQPCTESRSRAETTAGSRASRLPASSARRTWSSSQQSAARAMLRPRWASPATWQRSICAEASAICSTSQVSSGPTGV
jgi:hypothetical protein